MITMVTTTTYQSRDDRGIIQPIGDESPISWGHKLADSPLRVSSRLNLNKWVNWWFGILGKIPLYWLVKFRHPKNSVMFLNQLMSNRWFGDRWFGIRIGVRQFVTIPFTFGDARNPNHKPKPPMNHYRNQSSSTKKNRWGCATVRRYFVGNHSVGEQKWFLEMIQHVGSFFFARKNTSQNESHTGSEKRNKKSWLHTMNNIRFLKVEVRETKHANEVLLMTYVGVWN